MEKLIRSEPRRMSAIQRGKISFVVVCGLLLFSMSTKVYAQTERWVYRYNGPADSADCANSIVYGGDGNIYAAGYSQGIGAGSDFIVISLNKETGDTNWVYRYNGPGNGEDAANFIVYGNDGNIYAAGYSSGTGSERDFMVVSLTPVGGERWVYQYNGPGNTGDVAFSIVYGADGNIYAAGGSGGVGTYSDFTIISLTSAGSERWVYRYDGADHQSDGAWSLVYGADGNIYAAGYIGVSSFLDYLDFGVISVTSSGSERWVYQYDGVGPMPNSADEAKAIVWGADSNVYVAGYSDRSSTGIDFTLLSLTPTGSERWVYQYARPQGNFNNGEAANSIVYGADGNIYAVGYTDSCESPASNSDFTVISVTSTGSERWVYWYDGGYLDWANALVYGADSNMYVAGMSFYSNRAFAVVSLTSSGSEQWIYIYDTSWVDEAYAVVYGADGNIYAAGYSENRDLPFSQDFIVISLDPESGIEEESSRKIIQDIILLTSTLQNKNLTFSLSLPEPTTVLLFLYSITGEKILSWQISAPSGTSRHTKDVPSISSGVYVLKAKTEKGGHEETRKFIIVK